MNLRPKMLLVFATTVAGGMGFHYFLSRDLLLSSFRQLETEQMHQNLEYSLGKIVVSTRIDGDCVEIAIFDSGTGIPLDVRDKIFDPFFTTKGVEKGTAHGLALARAIVVEKHGGSPTFETQTGKGPTFFVRLPLSAAARREEALVT
jgi:C4-dicarboxylate-specific signal transduction histidine kinase